MIRWEGGGGEEHYDFFVGGETQTVGVVRPRWKPLFNTIKGRLKDNLQFVRPCCATEEHDESSASFRIWSQCVSFSDLKLQETLRILHHWRKVSLAKMSHFGHRRG